MMLIILFYGKVSVEISNENGTITYALFKDGKAFINASKKFKFHIAIFKE